jgi:transcriptional regulator GlxA family with amidase domain
MADLTFMTYESAMRVQVLALEGSTPLVPIGFVDVLRRAQALAPHARPVTISLVSAGATRTVHAAGGVDLRADASVETAEPGDLVIASALDVDVSDHLEKNRRAVPFLKEAFARGATVASACTGAFVLAEAGPLDGRRATTHWGLCDLLASRHPRVRVAPQAVIVDTGRVITAGGSTSFLNLALLLAGRLFGRAVERTLSKILLVDPNKPPQSAYATFLPHEANDDEIRRAQALIEATLAKSPSIDAIARAVGMSTRNFTRRFQRATGDAPRTYIQRVRVEAAKRALESTREPVRAVAARVAYGDVVAFRKLFVRMTGLTPVDYRARYGAHAGAAWIGRRAD